MKWSNFLHGSSAYHQLESLLGETPCWDVELLILYMIELFLFFFCLFVLANLIHQWIFSFSYRFTWACFVSLYVYFLFGGDGDARFCLHPRVPCATCGPRFWDFRRRLRWRHAEAKNAGLSRAFREWVKLPRRISKSEIEKGEIAPRTGRRWCVSSRTRKQTKQKFG